MKVLVIPNLKKRDSVLCTNKSVDILAGLSAIPMLDNQYIPYIEHPEKCVFGDEAKLLEECDVLLPIGGDGTILHTVTHSIDSGKPVVGINTGRVGFLTQLEGSELDNLALLVAGNYRIQERMMLELTVGTPETEHTMLALNDVIISRGNNKITELGVYREGNLIVRHRADGIILSTPTGSTGYSLSAGGAVVDPSLSVILLTAICPYSSFNRSLILPPGQVYTVRLEEEGQMRILVDGELTGGMDPGCLAQVKQSDKKAKLIDLCLRDFYCNLREKLILRR